MEAVVPEMLVAGNTVLEEGTSMNLTIVDNLWVECDGIYPQIEKALSFKAPGARFTPSFKAGHWDGTIKLTHTKLTKDRKTHVTRFPVGLLGVITAPKTMEAKVTDLRVRPDKGEYGWSDVQLVELDPHQEEAVAAAVVAGRGLIQYPTGTGKGRIIGETSRRLNVRTLVLCDKKDLLYQLAGEICYALWENETDNQVGIYGDGLRDTRSITVATWQSINTKLQQGGSAAEQMLNWLSTFQAVLVDEAHHLEADGMAGILESMPNAYYRLGFSAKPFRSFAGKTDDRGTWLKVQAATGAPIMTMSIQEGVKTGRIVAADVFMIHGADDPTDHTKDITWNYTKEYEAGVIENVARNVTIVKLASKLMHKGPTVILVSRVEHGQMLMDAFPPWETQHSALVTGQTPSKLRKEYYEAFKQGNISCLIIGKLGDEALDLPNIQYLIMTGGGKANHIQIQRIGRALRASPGKTKAMAFDFYDKGKYLESHSKRRRSLYQQEPAYTFLDVEMADIV